VTDPGTEGDGDYTIGPDYTDSPDLDMQSVPRGTLYDFTMNSTDSTIYRGDDATLLPQNQRDFTRAIRVYVPAQYVDGTAAPFMIVQDGFVGDIQRALDNLIASTTAGRQLPAIVAIFVANGGGDSKGSQRGLEYDTVSDRYTQFIETEVLPAVVQNADILADHPNFALTSDPEGRGAYGCSSGGAAAFTMGWFSPDLYRRIITYSGTFVDQQDDDAAEEATYPLGAWEYHDRLIGEADPKPLRVFLHVSENDNGAGTAENTYHNWVMANERMAEQLAAKGYHYRFLYALGAGHCDAAVRRETLPDTLLWMWRGYPLD
jgi:enterochelin esterase-like enzyme